MLYINGFVSTSSTKKWKAFSKFRIYFRIFDRKPKHFQRNKEARIFIELQYVIYQWIHLDELYKLTEKFFSNFKSVCPKFWPKTENFGENQKIFNK